MELSKNIIRYGFILSGLMNIVGVLVFSRFFTNEVISKVDPAAMSTFGLIMIVVWGLVFFAVSNKYEHLKWLVGVFIIEKLIYAVNWTKWIAENSVSAVYE